MQQICMYLLLHAHTMLDTKARIESQRIYGPYAQVAHRQETMTVQYRTAIPLIQVGYIPRSLFQNLHWMPETKDSNKPYVYCVFFLYMHTYDKV